MLVAGAGSKWTVSSATYVTLQKERASVQIAVQINFRNNWLPSVKYCILPHQLHHKTTVQQNTTKIRVFKPDVSFPIAVVVLVSQIPFAIWAGAVTPLSVATKKPAEISIPQFKDMSDIREWPSEIGRSGPLVRNTFHLFSRY